MKIYFAGSIRGGRADVGLYQRVIEFLKQNHIVLTEHVGDLALQESATDVYNGPHVKTTSKKILVNGRFVRRWRAALKSSSAKVP